MTIRKLLQIGLSTQGYKVIESSNGRDELHLFSQNLALIILDLGLPDIQGFELLRKIHACDGSVPVMVLSGRGEETARSKRLISVPTTT
jgi:two-component system, OmpR family, KDP operon response regulator KdpE